MYQNTIETAIDKSDVIALFTNRDSETSFTVGIPRTITSHFVIVSSISKDGLSDGIAIRANDRVFRVERDTGYLRSLGALWKMNGCHVSNFEKETNFGDIGDLDKVFAILISSKLIISVWINGDQTNEICGTVLRTDSETVEISMLSEYGASDGTCVIGINDIHSLNIDGVDERRRLAFCLAHE